MTCSTDTDQGLAVTLHNSLDHQNSKKKEKRKKKDKIKPLVPSYSSKDTKY